MTTVRLGLNTAVYLHGQQKKSAIRKLLPSVKYRAILCSYRTNEEAQQTDYLLT